MINPRITGTYISRLRKEKDWTQLELADRLNVTPQAVSRWEKGDSFPDIAVMAALSKLFAISVDDLLNGGPRVAQPQDKRKSSGMILNELAEGHLSNVSRLVKEDPANVDALIEVAPLTSLARAEVDHPGHVHFFNMLVHFQSARVLSIASAARASLVRASRIIAAISWRMLGSANFRKASGWLLPPARCNEASIKLYAKVD